MHVTLALVSSVDGFITRGEEGPSHWSSSEDKQHFEALIEQSSIVVMGRKTYEASKDFIRSRLLSNKLRIVLTSTPEQFATETVPGQLEFSSEKPSELVERLALLVYTDLLVVGGSQVNSAFLETGYINELQLTIEPMIFGRGTSIGSEKLSPNVQLKLLQVRQLNSHGTLLLQYSVS